MLKAKLDRVRKNKKGFSLVELIIVIAIMVALIAVMAPSFVKYVQKSRDTALSTAAEDLYSAVKVFYGDPECPYSVPASATITVSVDSTSSPANQLKVEQTGLSSSGELDAIIAAAGAETGKVMGKTTKVGTITITNVNGEPAFTMTVS